MVLSWTLAGRVRHTATMETSLTMMDAQIRVKLRQGLFATALMNRKLIFALKYAVMERISDFTNVTMATQTQGMVVLQRVKLNQALHVREETKLLLTIVLKFAQMV